MNILDAKTALFSYLLLAASRASSVKPSRFTGGAKMAASFPSSWQYLPGR
jgi:hypothetical protein